MTIKENEENAAHHKGAAWTGHEEQPLPPPRLRPGDVVLLGSAGARARPLRALLSALGIAIGIAAMVAVIGVSASSTARISQQLETLGTNMLTVSPGTTLSGQTKKLPVDAAERISLIDGVEKVASTGTVQVPVYRSPLSDRNATGGISTLAADESLLEVLSATLGSGRWLNSATSQYPAVVLGSAAAQRLGVVSPGTQVAIGQTLFTVLGILDPVTLAPELDNAALVGKKAATSILGWDGHPTKVYERSTDASVGTVRSLLAATVAPQDPSSVSVSRPSEALTAKRTANQTLSSLLAGVGSIALLVGSIGVANTMIISVLERRREIGLRRSLGAMRRHVLEQFLVEALVLAGAGGLLGCVLGAATTAAVAAARHWPVVLPALVVPVAMLATMVIGVIAGLYPAVKASRVPPAAALTTP